MSKSDFALGTTLMVRNIPNKYSQRMVKHVIEKHGFKNTFDFLYVPSDFSTRVNVGYCFVNFVESKYAQQFARVFHRLHLSGFKSKKLVQISLGTTQGLKPNIAKFEDSTLCSEFVAPEFHPLIFDTKTGEEIPFRSLMPGYEPLPPSRIEDPEFWANQDEEHHQPKWEGDTIYPRVILNKPTTANLDALEAASAENTPATSRSLVPEPETKENLTISSNSPGGNKKNKKNKKKQKNPENYSSKDSDFKSVPSTAQISSSTATHYSSPSPPPPHIRSMPPPPPPPIRDARRASMQPPPPPNKPGSGSTTLRANAAAFEMELPSHFMAPPPPPRQDRVTMGGSHFPVDDYSHLDPHGGMSPATYAIHHSRYSNRSKSVSVDPFSLPPGLDHGALRSKMGHKSIGHAMHGNSHPMHGHFTTAPQPPPVTAAVDEGATFDGFASNLSVPTSRTRRASIAAPPGLGSSEYLGLREVDYQHDYRPSLSSKTNYFFKMNVSKIILNFKT